MQLAAPQGSGRPAGRASLHPAHCSLLAHATNARSTRGAQHPHVRRRPGPPSAPAPARRTGVRRTSTGSSSPARRPAARTSRWRRSSRPAAARRRTSTATRTRRSTSSRANAFLLGDEWIAAGVGDFVNVPRGTVHWFHNGQRRPARMILTFTPAGIENFFKETLEPRWTRPRSPGQHRRGHRPLRRGRPPLRARVHRRLDAPRCFCASHPPPRPGRGRRHPAMRGAGVGRFHLLPARRRHLGREPGRRSPGADHARRRLCAPVAGRRRAFHRAEGPPPAPDRPRRKRARRLRHAGVRRADGQHLLLLPRSLRARDLPGRPDRGLRVLLHRHREQARLLPGRRSLLPAQGDPRRRRLHALRPADGLGRARPRPPVGLDGSLLGAGRQRALVRQDRPPEPGHHGRPPR